MAVVPHDEIKRKLFHLLSLLYIAAYGFLPRSLVLWALGVLFGIVVCGELARLRSPAFDRWVLGLLGGVHRDHEQGAVSGLPWTLSGSWIAMFLFPQREVVLAALLYMALGDAAAALVGRAWGRVRLPGGKTLEGSIACAAVCFVVGIPLLGVPLAAAGAIAAALIELVPWPLNDNFWMPSVSCAALLSLRALL